MDFHGTPDRVRVTMLAPAGGEKISRKVTLPVLALERFRYAETPDVIAVSGPVYNHGIEAALRDFPVDLTTEEIATGILVAHSEYGNSLSFNYPALFPRAPVRVTGQVPVQRLTGITRVAYAPDDALKDDLPNGLTIKGNMLLIDPKVFPTVGEEIRLFATNGEGRFLSLLHEESIQSENGMRQKTQYYYGEIGGIVLLERGDIETLPYAFDAVLEPVSQ